MKKKYGTQETAPVKKTLLVAVADGDSGFVQTSLQASGFGVISAASEEDVLSLFLQHRPELMLVDVGFGGGRKGIAAGKKLQKLLDIPLLYLARDVDAHLLRQLLEVGAHGLVMEPVRPATLLASVEVALAHYEKTQAPRREDHHFRTILNSIVDAVITVDRKLRIAYMNRAAENITEHEADESAGKDLFSVFDFPSEDAQKEALHIFRAVLTSGIPSALPDPTTLIGKYGTKILIGDSVAPIVEQNGAVSGLVIVFRSVTEREDAKKAEHARMANLDAFMDALPAAVFLARDAEGAIVSGNRAAYEALGLCPGSNIARFLEDTQQPGSCRILRDGKEVAAGGLPVQEAARTGNAVRGVELTLEFGDGTQRTLFGDAMPLRDEQGQPCGGVSAMFDITARKQTEEALVRSNQALDRFAYLTSHDLQEPLNTVIACTHILERQFERSSDERTRKYVGLVHRTAMSMHALLQSVLTYSRTLQEEFVRPEPTRAAEALQGALAGLQAQVRESGAMLLLPETVPEVMAHPAWLLQVFQNLIANAIRYRKITEPVTIRVSVEKSNGEWLFSVRDNGMGFEPSQAQQVFGAFQRLHQRGISGQGIGLATCKAIIERLGGRIWAEAVKGVGATFRFTLPAVK